MVAKIYSIVKGILFTILFALLFIYQDDLLLDLHWLVGAASLYFGLEGIFLFVLKRKSLKEDGWSLFFCVFEYVLGIFIFSSIRDYTTVCIIWAVWAIMRGTFEIYESILEFLKKEYFLLPLAAAIIEIVFSFLLLLEPGVHHAKTHIYILAVELLTSGVIFPMLYMFLSKYKEKIIHFIRRFYEHNK